jgi:hypothetical protein
LCEVVCLVEALESVDFAGGKTHGLGLRQFLPANLTQLVWKVLLCRVLVPERVLDRARFVHLSEDGYCHVMFRTYAY